MPQFPMNFRRSFIKTSTALAGAGLSVLVFGATQTHLYSANETSATTASPSFIFDDLATAE